MPCWRFQALYKIREPFTIYHFSTKLLRPGGLSVSVENRDVLFIVLSLNFAVLCKLDYAETETIPRRQSLSRRRDRDVPKNALRPSWERDIPDRDYNPFFVNYHCQSERNLATWCSYWHRVHSIFVYIECSIAPVYTVSTKHKMCTIEYRAIKIWSPSQCNPCF